MIALALILLLAPVPMPLPIPTSKPLQALPHADYMGIAWQSTWPRIIVVGRDSVYSLTAAPDGRLSKLNSKKSGVSKTD